MNRRAARIDGNHRDIADTLRGLGVSVVTISARGFPDLLCGYRGRNFLLEVKDGSRAASARRLSEDQVTFHKAWEGQAAVVRSVDEARRVIGC